MFIDIEANYQSVLDENGLIDSTIVKHDHSYSNDKRKIPKECWSGI